MKKEQAYTKITVAEGDTLWGLHIIILQKICLQNKWIKEVMKLNNLSTATIKIGEDLLLPTVRTVNDNQLTINWRVMIE